MDLVVVRAAGPCPDHIRGRIIAGDFGIVTLIITVSNLIAGVLADVIGVRVTIAVFALIGVAGSLAYQVATRPIRQRLDAPA